MARSKSQDIGDAGESEFDRLARLAHIVSTKPNPDVIGADRVVELPWPSAPGSSADAAIHTSTLWVQVKTTSNETRTWDVNLENCKRFVDIPLPAFFVLVHVDQWERATRISIRHVDEVLGGDILRRIRKVGPKAAKLHKLQFKVRWEQVHDIQPEPDALDTRLRELIGDANTYATRKAAWRSSVGYPTVPIELAVRADSRDMIRHVLGELAEVTVQVTRARQTRFEIPRPYERIPLNKDLSLKFGMHEGQPMTILVRTEEDWESLPGTFWHALGLFSGLAGIAPDTTLWRFEAGIVRLRCSSAGELTVSIGFGGARIVPLSEWRQSFKFAKAIVSGEFSLYMDIGATQHQLTDPKKWPSNRTSSTLLGMMRFVSDLAAEARLGGATHFSGNGLIGAYESCLRIVGGTPDATVSIRLHSADVCVAHGDPEPMVASVPLCVRVGALLFTSCARTSPAYVQPLSAPVEDVVAHYESAMGERDLWVVHRDPAEALARLRKLVANSKGIAPRDWEDVCVSLCGL